MGVFSEKINYVIESILNKPESILIHQHLILKNDRFHAHHIQPDSLNLPIRLSFSIDQFLQCFNLDIQHRSFTSKNESPNQSCVREIIHFIMHVLAIDRQPIGAFLHRTNPQIHYE